MSGVAIGNVTEVTRKVLKLLETLDPADQQRVGRVVAIMTEVE